MPMRDELCGRRVGEFVLRERIGEGAYGVVYRAEQPLLGREAVIKVLHGRLRASQVMIQRFLREARLASRLDHPFAAHVYAFGAEKADGLLWIAMEMVHGTPLDAWLRARGPMPLAELVPFFERIAEVVQTGHERGIVHRDLKPSNVMVIERAGRLLPKLLDFGIAKLLLDDEEEPAEASQLLLAQAEARPGGGAGEGPGPAVLAPAPLTGTLTATIEAADPGVPLQTELTATGMTMGSPPYMAPEQWSGQAVGPSADLYALGVLAYEALAGRRPFMAMTMEGLANLHQRQPPPPLGGEHPAALDRFFSRALAKRPEDRPASGLELAAALRVAAGLAEDPAELPRLERGIHDPWIADAPQPLAEAVAALEGARNVHQARDAARELFRMLVRYLLALALASRAQVREARTDPVADALLRELGRRPLDDGERVRLMRQLVQALAGRRGAYPIPPLVDLLVPRAGAADALEPVLQLDSLMDPRVAGEELVRSQLAQLVLALGRLLRAASFVLDYRLVVARAGAPESWMGLRRGGRRGETLREPALPVRQPVLLDREGRSALVLWPLVQVAPPTPEAADELFVFDGPDRGRARLIAAPHGFELHDPGLWDWLGEHAFPRSADDPTARSEERAPYRGLEAFSAADADRFVGREREVDALANRLRTTALQVVVGASGAGKSSFVHAGLVPALPPGSRVVTLRPGNRPVATLATRLGAVRGSTAELSGLLDASAAAAQAAAAAFAASTADDGLTVVIVDQLEELFTLCRDEAARERFALILDALASTPDGRVRVIGTLRDDFLMRATALPVLGPRLAASVFFLGNPSREDLIRTIVEPARRAGYELSDPELAPEMASAVAGRPGALALLSFTASRLWELRDRQFHRLTRRAYEAMGGVGGALGQHAEDTIAALGAEERRLVRAAFRHLVTAEGTRAQLSVADLGQVLASPSAGAVTDKLVAARLLVVAEHEDGARVEIIHEALLTAWPRVQEWMREDADSARMRDQVRAAARQWDERGRARGLLWRHEALAELERWRSHHEGHGLTVTERAFADASRAAAARGRRVRRRALITAFAVLGGALAIMFWLRGEATEQRSIVVAQARKLRDQLVQNLVERGQQALFGGNVEAALKYLGEASELGDRSAAVRFMLARARESKQAELATLAGHTGHILYASFSPDGTRVLTAGRDPTVRIWDAATGRELHVLRDHAAPVVAAWSPTGELVTDDAAGVIRQWTRDGQLRTTIRGTPGTTNRITFTRDGARFAVARADGHVAIGDTGAGTLRAQWRADAGSAEAIAFDPSGTLVVTGGRSSAVVWSIEGQELARLEGHTNSIWHAVFDATGARVITASLDKTARVWDARSGKLLHRLVGHDGRVTCIALDDRAQRLVTASGDTTVRVWSLDTGDLLATLRGHTAQVNTVAFAPGDQLVSTSSDGTARVWDLSHGVETATYHHGGFLRAGSLDPAGRRLVTAGWSGTAKIWDLGRQSRLETYASPVAGSPEEGSSMYAAMVEAGRLAHVGPRGLAVWSLAPPARWTWSAPDIVSGALSPDGRVGVAADTQGVIHVFDHVLDARGVQQHQFRGPSEGVRCIAVFPDGRRAVTCSPGGLIAVWELATGRCIAKRQVGAVSEIGVSRDGSVLFAFESASQQLQGKASAWLLSGDLSQVSQLDHDGGVLNAKLSPDETRLVTLSLDGNARVWRRDGALEATLPHGGPVAVATWSSEGSWLATGTYGGTLTIWDRATWRARKVIDAHTAFINAIAIDEHDGLIASSGGDEVLKLWDVESFLQVARIPTGMVAAHLAFHRDQILVTGPLATQAWRCDR